MDCAPRFERIGDMIRAQASGRGERTALRCGSRKTSYRALHQRSNRVAHGLLADGVRSGQRILWFAKNNERYFEAFFGAAKANAVICPVNWRLSNPELDWIVADSGARIAFVGEEFESRIPDIPALHSGMTVIRTVGHEAEGAYESWREGFEGTEPDIAVDPGSDALQLYTSGTTGRPKGAYFSHRALLVFRTMSPEAQPEWNRWTDEDVSLLITPQFHIAGTGHGLQTICAGATGFIMREFDPARVLELIEHERLSKVFVVPAMLEMLLREPRVREIDYRRVRSLVYGSSPIPLALLREAMAVFGCGFVQQYGMTEASGTVTVLPPEDHDPAGTPRMRSVGLPLQGVDIKIVDAQGVEQPVGEVGEVAIHTPTLMTGYWRRPEATAAVIDDRGYYRSGDAGHLDADGYLYIRDRLKDMIISGGENIYPAEVEGALSGHPAVREIAVIGVPDKKWGEAVKAMVVLERGQEISADDLVGWGRALIAGYKLPKSIEFIDALPRNASGKILRHELRAPYWAGYERGVN